MKKRIVIIVLIVCMMIVLGGWYAYNRANAVPFASRIRNKLGRCFQIEDVEIINDFMAISDMDLALKFKLSNREPLTQKLTEKGWRSEPIPEQIAYDRILSQYDEFDREMIEYTQNYDCQWIFIDVYNQHYKRRKETPETKGDIYGSPHFRLAVYVPEYNLLLYREIAM